MKHPMQYQHTDLKGVTRFKENQLVSWLIDQLPDGLNSLSIESQTNSYTHDDYDQILQQIGYSVSGIPYRDHEKFAITDEQIKPEDHYEKAYKLLKLKMRPIVNELFDIEVD